MPTFKLIGTTVAGYLLLGASVMAGMRLVEWAVPRPATKILICMVDDTGTVEVCKSLDELRKRGVLM